MALSIGQSVLADMATRSGFVRWGATVERIEPGTVFVRLTGFGEGPYRAGDCFPVDTARVQPMPGWDGTQSWAGL